jgi:hypothetical protein
VDRGGLWRAAALEASRSKTPTNGAELGKQSLKIEGFERLGHPYAPRQ